MIDNKFLYFKTYEDFKEKLDAGLINRNSIVFIEDSQLIWTHDTEFTSTSYEESWDDDSYDDMPKR